MGLGLLGLLLACAPLACTSHTQARTGFIQQVRLGEYDGAEATLRKIGGKSRVDQLVDVMDRAMLLHRRGDCEASNRFLEVADGKIEEFYTTKVSDTLKSLAWNDTSATYVGDDFERNMVDIVQALNYASMDNLQAALVEARQVNRKLGLFAAKLRQLKITTGFTADPFANYIACLIHEAGGDNDAAYLSCQQAHQGYESVGRHYGVGIPQQLGTDLIRTARRAGRAADVARWRRVFPRLAARAIAGARRSTEIVVVVGLGLIAHKVSRKWVQMHGTDSLIVTYPEYVMTPTDARQARVYVDGQRGGHAAQMVHNLSQIAVGVMRERNLAMKKKAFAAALARLLSRKVAQAIDQNSSNNYVKAGAKLYNLFSKTKEVVEVADTRSWQTLPSWYGVARIPVKPGAYGIRVDFSDAAGRVLRSERQALRVARNSKAFVVAYSADRPMTDRKGPARAPRVYASKPARQTRPANSEATTVASVAPLSASPSPARATPRPPRPVVTAPPETSTPAPTRATPPPAVRAPSRLSAPALTPKVPDLAGCRRECRAKDAACREGCVILYTSASGEETPPPSRPAASRPPPPAPAPRPAPARRHAPEKKPPPKTPQVSPFKACLQECKGDAQGCISGCKVLHPNGVL